MSGNLESLKFEALTDKKTMIEETERHGSPNGNKITKVGSLSKILAALKLGKKSTEEPVSKKKQPDVVSKMFCQAKEKFIEDAAGISCEKRAWSPITTASDELVEPSPALSRPLKIFPRHFIWRLKLDVVFMSTCFSVILFYATNSTENCAFSQNFPCQLQAKAFWHVNSLVKQTIPWVSAKILASLVTMLLLNCIWLTLNPWAALWTIVLYCSALLKRLLSTSLGGMPKNQNAVYGGCFQMPPIGDSFSSTAKENFAVTNVSY